VPAPSAIITSGRGVQGLWTLSDDQLLPDAQDAVEQANLWLIEVLGAPSGTHNVDRILRLPGSWNALSKKKIEAGYQPAMADIIELNDNTYRLEDFGKPTTKQTLSPSTAGGGADDCTADPITIEELGPLREKYDLPIRITSLIGRGHPGAWLEDYERDFGKCKKDPNNRSDWVFDVCCNLLRFGVEEGEILGIMIDPKWPISAHCMDQGSPERAARRQIGRAKLRVLADPGSSTGGRGGNDGPRGVSLGMLARQPFDTDQKGRPLLTTLNTHRALARIPGLILRYNAFADVETVEGLGEEFDGILTDAAVRRLRYMIENKFGFKMPKDEFHEIVSDVCRYDSFHPVKDMFEVLPDWDGVKRIDTWLRDYAGVEDNPYTRAIGRIVLVAAIRRILEPGIGFQEVLVLVSAKQGTGKTELIKTLAMNKHWYTSNMPLNASPKEVIECLSGHWLVECGEMEGLSGKTADRVKNMMSRQIDIARLSYARKTSHVKRQSIMIGTTNRIEFNADPTGGRRWWPVRVKEVDLDRLLVDRQQLWAEALIAAQARESIKLSRELWPEAERAQTTSTAKDPWAEVLEDTLGDYEEGKIKVSDVRIILEEVAQKGWGPHSDARMGQAMRNMSWEKHHARLKHPLDGGKKRAYAYVKGKDIKTCEWIIVDQIAVGKLGKRTRVRRERDVQHEIDLDAEMEKHALN
jgi:hypothetical protein